MAAKLLHLTMPASIVEASKPHSTHFQDAHCELTAFLENDFMRDSNLHNICARQDQGQLETRCRGSCASASAVPGGECGDGQHSGLRTEPDVISAGRLAAAIL